MREQHMVVVMSYLIEVYSLVVSADGLLSSDWRSATWLSRCYHFMP